jgi:hypothetical protein
VTLGSDEVETARSSGVSARGGMLQPRVFLPWYRSMPTKLYHDHIKDKYMHMIEHSIRVYIEMNSAQFC